MTIETLLATKGVKFNMKNPILTKAEEIQNWVVEIRRDFHKHPEESYKEYRTTKVITEELEKMGIKTKPAGDTGVIGIIKGSKEGKVVGLRADIDALPVTEDTGLPFTSENPGFMHACGHDSHAAMLLGAAKILSEMKNELNGTVKLIFQPAEESGTGAKTIISNGVLTDPPVDAIFGMHIMSDIPCGKVVVQEGPLMASGDIWSLEITGKQSHGSAPWQGVDANICAGAIMQGFQTIVSRVNDVRSPIVINVGTIHGGDRFNITSGRAVLEGMNRTFSEEIRKNLPVWMEKIIKGTCEAYGCEYKFVYNPYCAVTENEPETTEKVRAAMSKLIDSKDIIQIEKVMGSEDFSEYQLHVKGSFAVLGGGNKDKDCIYSQHSNHFKIDEDAFPIGVAGYVQTAIELLG